jgi:uncharacterized protein involved in cysteine biosynthesis
MAQTRCQILMTQSNSTAATVPLGMRKVCRNCGFGRRACRAARRQRIGETIASTLRLTGLTLLLNLLALPVYLLVPGINLSLFLSLNGYLLGREYFEVVALRGLDAAATRAARNRFCLRVFLGGS